MNLDKKKIIDFLLTADFNISQGFSYNNLIDMLNHYKNYYSELYDRKEYYRKQIDKKNTTIEELENRIKELDKEISDRQTRNEILTSKLSKKLTFLERLKGKFIW